MNKVMAEREGFEPPIPVKVCPLSRRIVSTTHAPLRVGQLSVADLQETQIPRFARDDNPRCVGLMLAIDDQQLATISKERLQQLCAAACQNPTSYFHLVVQLRVIQDLQRRMDRTRLRVFSAVNQAPDARMNHRSGAHRARFNCSKQLALAKTMVTNGCTRLSERDDFGVSRGIRVGDVAVPSASDDSIVANDHCADRHLSYLQSTLGAAKGLLHPELIGRSLVVGHEREAL